MTVRCVSDAGKEMVCDMYKAKQPMFCIAGIFGVSPRTISRVLIEAGLKESYPIGSAKTKSPTSMGISKYPGALLTRQSSLNFYEAQTRQPSYTHKAVLLCAPKRSSSIG